MWHEQWQRAQEVDQTSESQILIRSDMPSKVKFMEAPPCTPQDSKNPPPRHLRYSPQMSCVSQRVRAKSDSWCGLYECFSSMSRRCLIRFGIWEFCVQVNTLSSLPNSLGSSWECCVAVSCWRALCHLDVLVPWGVCLVNFVIIINWKLTGNRRLTKFEPQRCRLMS